MRILLISPLPVYPNVPQPHWIPLGLAFMASILRKNNHKISIFDRHAAQSRFGIDRNKINAAMIEHIRKFKPDLIGMQTISPLIYDTVECVNLIREVYSGQIIAGGHHATALPELTLLKIPELSGVVVEEGEIPISRIANGENPSSIPGFWWKDDDNSVVNTLPTQNTNLDELPFPAFDLLDMKYYTRPNTNVINGLYLSAVSLLTSRGCVNQCEFCSESLTYGKGVRFHSPEYIIEWMKSVFADYEVEGIYFHDNDFLIRESRTRDICEKILSNGLHEKLKWAIQARADRINKDILKLLKKAGCVLIEIGVESNSQYQLNGINKQTTVGINEKVVDLCRQTGISVHVYMMTGFEGETISDLNDKLHWLKKLNPNSFTWTPLMIHPGTVLYEKHGNRFFEKNNWDRQSIEDHNKKDMLSNIKNEERTQWAKKYFLPYRTWHSAFNFLKINPSFKIILFVFAKRKKLIKFFILLVKTAIGYSQKSENASNAWPN